MNEINVNGKPYYRIISNDILNCSNKLEEYRANNKPVRITQHWTAGRYEQAFNDYQILIANDYILLSKNPLNYREFQHTWKMNTSNIGISYMAMFNSKFPILDNMLENMAKSLAVLVNFYKISWDNVKDHKYFSDNSIPSSYGNETRIDVGGFTRKNAKKNIFLESIDKGKWYEEKYIK